MTVSKLIKWWIVLAVLVIIYSGCNTTFAQKRDKKAVMKAFLAEVRRHDGISEKEAILIAQSEIIFRGYDESYYIDEPQVWAEDEDKYQVRFFRISNRTLKLVQPNDSILVVVKKDKGQVSWEL